MALSPTPVFHVRAAHWPADEPALAWVRRVVFIDEQQVPEHEEWDGADGTACHWLALDPAGAPLGTARLLPDGRIGRMAVVAQARGTGVGAALLQAALQAALARGDRLIWLDAQVHAIPFYGRAGFEAEGPEFLDAGIRHRRMVYRGGHPNTSR